jgi:serine/threonine protein kinase
LEEGRLVGRFELLRYLGRGGSGDVHLAWDPNRRAEIALKLIRIGVDDEMLEAEKRGVALQQRLQPKVPQIPAILEFDEVEGFFYVAMEYVEGIDLADILKQGPQPPTRAVDIAIQLCAILEAMERVSKDLEEKGRRVIHSDIKPANIRLQAGDRVRLLDFGVAKSLTLSKKFTRNVFGSTAYLAPERLSNEVVDSHTDLWAVSVVLYEMLAGYVPFQGETTGAIERRIRSGQPPAPLPADCPAALKSILLKSLRTDPALRFPDAATLRRHLEAFRAGRPLAISEPTRKISAVDEGAAMRDRRTEPAPPTPKRSRSEKLRARARFRRRVAIFIGILTLALAAASHVYAWSHGRAIEEALTQDPEADLSDLCARFQKAKPYDFLKISLPGAARALKGALVAAADRTLSRFRAGATTVREDWEFSLRWLGSAAQLGDAEEELLGKIAICEGQLARIDAETLFTSSVAEAKEKWKDAQQSFERARMTAPELVEVYLALASVYSDPRTGLGDSRKLHEALEEAERRSAGQDERSKLALVEVRVNEATQTLERASRASGQERIDLLYEAGDGFEKAILLCQDLKRKRLPQACRKAQERQSEISRKLVEQNQV